MKLEKILTLETINTLTIIKESGEYVSDIEEVKNESLIRQATKLLVKLIEERLIGLTRDSSNT